ncbi:ALP1-like protein isoform X1 [Tanacetum coccineum]
MKKNQPRDVVSLAMGRMTLGAHTWCVARKKGLIAFYVIKEVKGEGKQQVLITTGDQKKERKQQQEKKEWSWQKSGLQRETEEPQMTGRHLDQETEGKSKEDASGASLVEREYIKADGFDSVRFADNRETSTQGVLNQLVWRWKLHSTRWLWMCPGKVEKRDISKEGVQDVTGAAEGKSKEDASGASLVEREDIKACGFDSVHFADNRETSTQGVLNQLVWRWKLHSTRWLWMCPGKVEKRDISKEGVQDVTGCAYIKTRRQATQVSRNSITRDRAGAHERLVAAYFTDSPMYNEKRFRQTFRMAHPLFNQIVNAVTTHSAYFQCNPDCAGREGISSLIKCTSAIRQLAYGVNASFLDEYMQISERSSRMSLDHFCQAVMEIYGPEFLRKPTVTDVEKLYRYHEEKHGFSGMLGSLDCTDWEWFGCPYAFKGQYVRRDHGSNPFILLVAVCVSIDLWI